MTMTCVVKAFIPRLFPSLNEVLRIRSQSRKHGWNNLKILCETAVKKVFRTCEMLPKKPYHIVFRWAEWNKRRDPDNVAAGGSKPILDALQEAGLIADDGWGYIGRIVHEFTVAYSEKEVGVTIEFWDDPFLNKNPEYGKRAAHPPAGVRIVRPVKSRATSKKKGVRKMAIKRKKK